MKLGAWVYSHTANFISLKINESGPIFHQGTGWEYMALDVSQKSNNIKVTFECLDKKHKRRMVDAKMPLGNVISLAVYDSPKGHGEIGPVMSSNSEVQ